VPAAPIAWQGLVFIGNAGGDFKGGKGRMYALDAKTGKIVWEFYLVPKVEGDPVRGPDQSCASADQIARARLVEVEQRIANLTALKAELQRMVTGCSHGRVDQCRVIEALANQRQR
jgi:glucose dehydrogenase